MKNVEKYLKNINELLQFLKDEDLVYVQTHNFPDHDAMACAFGMQYILSQFNIKSQIVYDGEIERDSLKEMIKYVKGDVKQIREVKMKESDKIIIVDGCKGNKNVTDFIGDEVAVIDHHNVVAVEDVEFSDIRTEYGACSTLVYDYIMELNLPLTKEIATCLMIGINLDTALLTRGVDIRDVEAYYNCFEYADHDFVNYVARNYISMHELKYYRQLIEKVENRGRVAFTYFEKGCPQNMLGILADFLLSLSDIDFVMLTANNHNKICFSSRSEEKIWDSSKVMRELLKNRGFGGGHAVMAGGVILDKQKFDEVEIKNHLYNILKI